MSVDVDTSYRGVVVTTLGWFMECVRSGARFLPPARPNPRVDNLSGVAYVWCWQDAVQIGGDGSSSTKFIVKNVKHVNGKEFGRRYTAELRKWAHPPSQMLESGLG